MVVSVCSEISIARRRAGVVMLFLEIGATASAAERSASTTALG